MIYFYFIYIYIATPLTILVIRKCHQLLFNEILFIVLFFALQRYIFFTALQINGVFILFFGVIFPPLSTKTTLATSNKQTCTLLLFQLIKHFIIILFRRRFNRGIYRPIAVIFLTFYDTYTTTCQNNNNHYKPRIYTQKCKDNR